MNLPTFSIPGNLGGIISSGGSLLKSGTGLLRDLLGKIVGAIGADTSLWVPLILVFISLFLSYKLLKNFVTTPFSGRYLAWYLLVSFLIFVVLNYL